VNRLAGRILPQSGTAFEVAPGEILRVIDPLGEQVADMVSFDASDPGDWLSSGRTIDYNSTIYVSTGHRLYSNRSSVHWTIVDDSVGRHDFLLAPCSREMFQLLYEGNIDRPGCFGNLAAALAPFGIVADGIPTTLNLFMNVEIAPDGKLTIGAPRSRPGDYIDLRAERSLVVGLTACSAELSNNGSFKPIDYEVRTLKGDRHD
jgi:uncharacterized protein YcgI (DUF1989 family)